MSHRSLLGPGQLVTLSQDKCNFPIVRGEWRGVGNFQRPTSGFLGSSLRPASYTYTHGQVFSPHADHSLWGSLLLGCLSLVGGYELPTATYPGSSSCHSRLRNCTQRETVQFPLFGIPSPHPQTCLLALPVVSDMTRTHPLWDLPLLSCLLVFNEVSTASFFVGSGVIKHRTQNDPRGTYAQMCYHENPMAGSTVLIEF